MIVVDASVLAPALSDDSDEGDHLRQRLRGQRLTAPELIDLEVQSVLRSAVRRGLLGERRARLALEDLASAPLHRASHRTRRPRRRLVPLIVGSSVYQCGRRDGPVTSVDGPSLGPWSRSVILRGSGMVSANDNENGISAYR